MDKIFISDNHTCKAFEVELNRFEQNKDIKSVLILAGADNKYPKEEYDPILKKTSLSIIGGIFPEILFEGKRYKSGTILIGIKNEILSLVINRDVNDVSKLVEDYYEGHNPKSKTVFIFADALSNMKNKVVESLYNAFGTLPNYIGGGAGALDFQSFPCLFSNEGMVNDGVVIGLGNFKSSIGVSHGWKPISEALKVTESKENKIISLDWQSPKEVYEQIIEKHSKSKVNFNAFLSTVKCYPFGISKLDSEMVVRDPFKIENESVYTLDNIEQGSHVHILYGNIDGLLSGASKASALASENDQGFDNPEVFLIDCITRVIFMGKEFEKEIIRLDPEKKGFGALSLGEIANNGDSYLEIFNKTAVVCHIDGG